MRVKESRRVGNWVDDGTINQDATGGGRAGGEGLGQGPQKAAANAGLGSLTLVSSLQALSAAFYQQMYPWRLYARGHKPELTNPLEGLLKHRFLGFAPEFQN